jgi:hypothetical protein
MWDWTLTLEAEKSMQLVREIIYGGTVGIQVKARMHVTPVYHVNKKSCANKRNMHHSLSTTHTVAYFRQTEAIKIDDSGAHQLVYSELLVAIFMALIWGVACVNMSRCRCLPICNTPNVPVS